MRTQRSRHANLTITAMLFGVFGLTVGALDAQTAVAADGIVESTIGGFKFPDGSVQLTAGGPGSAQVEDTGQTTCWNAAGSTVACAGSGQDGEFQRGVNWPTPRFVDNGDGTVLDNLTGLIWMKDAACSAVALDWPDALAFITTLNTTSQACTDYTAMTFTDWRLPNAKELVSLADYGRSSPVLPAGHPFVNVLFDYYWSSTTLVETTTTAFVFGMRIGFLTSMPKSDGAFFARVLAVRGGP